MKQVDLSLIAEGRDTVPAVALALLPSLLGDPTKDRTSVERAFELATTFVLRAAREVEADVVRRTPWGRTAGCVDGYRFHRYDRTPEGRLACRRCGVEAQARHVGAETVAKCVEGRKRHRYADHGSDRVCVLCGAQQDDSQARKHRARSEDET